MRMAAVAAPSGNEPSTVRSGKFRTRKVMNTPRATRLKTRPISSDPHRV